MPTRIARTGSARKKIARVARNRDPRGIAAACVTFGLRADTGRSILPLNLQ